MAEVDESGFPEVCVCQYCGRARVYDDVVRDEWLVSPRRSDPSVFVIRCPMHISEWAMRQSQAGRTNAMRERARRGRSKTLDPIRSFDPMPSRFRGAERE